MKSRLKLIPVLLGLLTIALIITSAMLVKTQNVYAAKDEKYRNLDTFTQVMHLIENNYVEEVDNKILVYGAIKGMLGELDPHSNFLDPDTLKEFREETQGEFGGLGITIGLKDKILTVVAPLEDTPAFRKGIQAGDQIVKIEGESTMGMTLHDAVKMLRGKADTDVTITIHRESIDKPFDVTITRAVIKVSSVKSNMIDGDIGYIRLIQFNNNVSDAISDAVKELDGKGAKSFIIDVRNNPGGLLTEAISVSSIFLPANKIVVYTKDRQQTRQDFKSKVFSTKELEKPIILLVNGGSASASEILTGALQDYERATIMGEKTYGKASVQSVMPLLDGSAIKLTTAKYFTPKGRSIHEIGIEPDITVEFKELTPEQIEEIEEPESFNMKVALFDLDKDNQLKAAVDKMKEILKDEQ
ncbi:carboxyl-terminal protease [Denitrovibrio acetiphilus DSM 12809]|uniref:Carboxyl-terminal protease n=1 Tax=Denitrovibrio acetiphilus (strain DSM 12809 / NBRC 114555 / N2460) TaxID=522772 RepID=D4H0R2_DENA2|nr:S41 family peptidase [Denitrovibrio acetiphilus]ADD68575.1 carboxyl-terminal protease [Denitrovibrio acetiphilus DSM 12809]